MTRAVTASLALAFVVLLVGFDLASAELNPYQAPAAFALGSGAVASRRLLRSAAELISGDRRVWLAGLLPVNILTGSAAALVPCFESSHPRVDSTRKIDAPD